MRTNLILAVLLFGVLFGPDTKWIHIQGVTLGVLAVALVSTLRINRNALILVAPALIVVISLGMYGGLVGVILGSFDRYIVLAAIKIVLYVLASYALVRLYWKKNGDEASEVLFIHIYWFGLFNVLTVYATILWKPAEGFALLVLDLPQHAEWWLSGQRSFDWAIGGGDGLAPLLAALFAMVLFGPARLLLLRSRLVSGSIIFGAGILTSMSAQLLMIFVLVYWLVILRQCLNWKVFVFFVLCMLFLFVAVIRWNSEFSIGINHVDLAVRRNLEWLWSIVESGTLETKSTTTIVNDMYFLPDGVSHVLFGDGNFGRNPLLPYIPSDVGYVRIWHGSGIVGIGLFLAYILWHLVMGVYMLRYSKLPMGSPFRAAGHIVLLMAFMQFLMNFKVLQFDHRAYVIQFLIIWAVFFAMRNNRYRARRD